MTERGARDSKRRRTTPSELGDDGDQGERDPDLAAGGTREQELPRPQPPQDGRAGPFLVHSILPAEPFDLAPQGLGRAAIERR